MANEFNAHALYKGNGCLKAWELATRPGAARVDAAITRYVAAAEALEGITAEDIRQYVADKSSVLELQISGGRDEDSRLANVIRINTNIADETASKLACCKRRLDVLGNGELVKTLEAIAAAESKVVENLTAAMESRREVADCAARELERRKEERRRKANPMATLEEMSARIQELEKLVADAKAPR